MCACRNISVCRHSSVYKSVCVWKWACLLYVHLRTCAWFFSEFQMQMQYLCIVYLLEFLGLGLHLLLQRSESLSQLQRLFVLDQHLLLHLPLATRLKALIESSPFCSKSISLCFLLSFFCHCVLQVKVLLMVENCTWSSVFSLFHAASSFPKFRAAADPHKHSSP